MDADQIRTQLLSLQEEYDQNIKVAGLSDLIQRLVEKLENVDAEEQAAILAKIAVATEALASKNYFTATLALMSAAALLYKATKDQPVSVTGWLGLGFWRRVWPRLAG